MTASYPPPPPGNPLEISWSALRTHMQCRQKAALLRAGHRTRAQNLRGFFHGMVVDKVMRDWLTDPYRRTGQMTERVAAYVAECEATAIAEGDGVVRWKHATDRTELLAFCTELLTRLEPLLDRLVLPYQFTSGHRFRQPIRVPYLDGSPTTIILRGEMDLLVRETDAEIAETDAGGPQWAVWDLKGTRDDSYWRKVLGQLLFYDLAVIAEHGVGTTRVGLIQPMCRKPFLQWRLDPDSRRQMFAHILRMAGDIWRADAACKDGTDGCQWCEVRHACVRYRPDTSTGRSGRGHTISFGDALRSAAAYTAVEAR